MTEALTEDSVVALDGDYGFSKADPGVLHVHVSAVEEKTPSEK